MYFTPTTFIAKLLAALQVLMTLDMPLSKTTALPVTSKPIESTVENLAWQAWIELPPEQKQQVKSRKVTPKSIFTLPLRVECPEGHKQVDTKCIPIAIGSNDVLIDLSALGLLVGNSQTEDLYDYDDMGEELSIPLAFGSEMPAEEAEKSRDGLKINLRPPAKDEPLKFNIFENKFHIFHEEPLEDYGSLSNEGFQSSEKEQNTTVTTTQKNMGSSNSTANATAINDLVSDASNISENSFEFYIKPENNSSPSDRGVEPKQEKILTNLGLDDDFNIEAISVPAFGLETAKQNNSSLQLVTTIMDTESTTTTEERDKQQESDITTLLQTESFMPLLNHTTATTLQSTEILSLSTIPLREPDILNLNVDEEATTLPNIMEQDALELKNKQEYTRSVTINPLLSNENDSDSADDNVQVKDSALELVTNDEPLETTTPIQLDETTIIESYSFLSTTPSEQQELKELLLQQEQAQKDFEELQRMRKRQKDQHVVLKKSKVQPVEVLSTTTEATNKITTAAATTATTTAEELTSTIAVTATPLLTVHNENENNDRFYYQHFTKQDHKLTLHSDSSSKPKQKTTTVAAKEAAATETLSSVATTGETTAKSNEVEKIPLTSEIDLAEELRLINELVKGIQQPTTLTTIKRMQTTTTTTAKPITTTTQQAILKDKIQSSSSFNSLSESSTSIAKKPTLTTSQIWSKIMPLLTTSTTTPIRDPSVDESFYDNPQKEPSSTQADKAIAASSARSNRNSKIIRINGFNKISAAKLKVNDATLATATKAIITEDSTPYPSTTSSSTLSSTTENNTYEPYWWLPIAWRLDKPTSSEKQPEKQSPAKSEEQPLLLRFWSAYAPKSS